VLLQGLTPYILLDRAQVKNSDAVLIAAAAGGAGGLALQLAKLRGAKVIALASESKVELLKGLGADHVFDYGKPGWSAKAADVTRPQGVQVYLDSMGDLATEAFSLLGQFGRWIIYGARSGKQNAPSGRRGLANDREEHFSDGLQSWGQPRSSSGRTQGAFYIRD
jgi:NADPH:quinone reductase